MREVNKQRESRYHVLVMAMAAREDLIATRSTDFASSPIVLASKIIITKKKKNITNYNKNKKSKR